MALELLFVAKFYCLSTPALAKISFVTKCVARGDIRLQSTNHVANAEAYFRHRENGTKN